MIYSINKSANPHNGLNITMRSMQQTGLTKHKIGFSYNDQDLQHADMIILGNYLPEEVYSIKTNLTSNVKIAYLYCSPFGQAGTNGELPILFKLKQMLGTDLDYLFCSCVDIPRVFNHPKVLELPVVSDFEGTFVPYDKRSGITLIGNNLRPSRNFPTQLAALKYMQIVDGLDLDEPINSYNMETEAYQFFMELLELDNWTNHQAAITEQDKKRIIAKSKLGLQITYSDSFNITAWEFSQCHVPCLTNSSLLWVPKEMRIGAIDRIIPMTIKIKEMLHDAYKYGDDFAEAGKKIMKRNLETCASVLRSCL